MYLAAHSSCHSDLPPFDKLRTSSVKGKNLGGVGDPSAGTVKLTGRVSNPPLLIMTYAYPSSKSRPMNWATTFRGSLYSNRRVLGRGS